MVSNQLDQALSNKLSNAVLCLFECKAWPSTVCTLHASDCSSLVAGRASTDISKITSPSASWTLACQTTCRLPRIASAAAAMARHWQELGGLGAVPFALPSTSPGARPSKGLAVPYGQLLGPLGAAHSAYLPPPPASSNAVASEPGFAGSTRMQPAMQYPQDQQPAQYLQHSLAVNSDAGPSASGFGDRSVVTHVNRCGTQDSNVATGCSCFLTLARQLLLRLLLYIHAITDTNLFANGMGMYDSMQDNINRQPLD